jgi:hypothetical protein
MKRISFLILAVCFAVVCMAQEKGKPIIVFPEKVFDFGTVHEEVGKITHEFEFTNSGDVPLVIQQVNASCGCTTPVWPKEPIPPGGKGKIVVTYSAAGRPFPFTKTITVYSNATENPVTLTIKGQVLAKPVSQEEVYPQVMGPVRVKSHYVALGNVVRGLGRTENFTVWNNSKSPVTLEVAKLPKYIKTVISPAEVKPGQDATIQFVVNTAGINDWGIHNDEVLLVVNKDKAASKDNKLTVTMNLMEDFSKLTPEQRKSGAIPEIAARDIKLGKIQIDSRKNGSFEVKNTGAATLILHKISVDCNCIRFKLPKGGIAPGKAAVVNFELTADKSLGQKIQTANIITNSPTVPFTQVRIYWETAK